MGHIRERLAPENLEIIKIVKSANLICWTRNSFSKILDSEYTRKRDINIDAIRVTRKTYRNVSPNGKRTHYTQTRHQESLRFQILEPSKILFVLYSGPCPCISLLLVNLFITIPILTWIKFLQYFIYLNIFKWTSLEIRMNVANQMTSVLSCKKLMMVCIIDMKIYLFFHYLAK